MKVLFDEDVPQKLARLLPRHEIHTVVGMEWGGIKNGDLLSLAENEFELFITADQNIRYQQNLDGFHIAILELSTNDLRRIQAAATLIRSTIDALQPGQFRHLHIP